MKTHPEVLSKIKFLNNIKYINASHYVVSNVVNAFIQNANMDCHLIYLKKIILMKLITRTNIKELMNKIKILCLTIQHYFNCGMDI
jgi:hypothetical protein